MNMPRSRTINSPSPAMLRQQRLPARITSVSPALALEGAILVLSFIAALIGSATFVHSAWSLMAAVNYLWLCTFLFRLEPRGTVLILPQLINMASSMAAMIMIEYRAEMFELALVGRPGPWSSELNLCDLLFCGGAITAIRPLLAFIDRRKRDHLTPVLDRHADLLGSLIVGLIGLIALAMIFRGLQSGFPLLTGTDRFEFRRFSADKITLYGLNFKFAISYALGFVSFVIPASRWLRLSASAVFAALLIIAFLFGDKFFIQLASLSAFATPYLYCNYQKIGRRIIRYGAAAMLALAAMMAVTTFIYSNGFTETSAATTKRLSGRMVGQGELWFLQSSIGGPLLTWNDAVIDRYQSSFAVKSVDLFAVQSSIGPHYFSNRYAPNYLRASLQKKAGSVTYTAVTEAMGLVLFGWIGLGIMMFALGALLGLACGYIAYAITTRSVISGVFAAYIYMQLRNSIIQAAPWMLAGFYSVRWLGLFLAIELVMVVAAKAGSRTLEAHVHQRSRLDRAPSNGRRTRPLGRPRVSRP